MAKAFQRLGRYLIIDEIAKGGMATVYRAKLLGVEGFEKDVAIKKILPFWGHQQEFTSMLIDEAKTLVHLQHNNIVQVVELAKEKDVYFIVMEYIHGFDLRKLTKKLKQKNQKLPLSLACYIIKEICKGLNFAHTRINQTGQLLNIVHRDISPQNILISLDGNVKITDFGIAKIIGKTSETSAGALKGKFSYMSPEQALGRDTNFLTDIFALGAVFFELIYLQKCFDGSNDLEIIDKVKNTSFIFPETTDKTLESIINKTLANNPKERFQSVMELRTAIKTYERSRGWHADQDDLRLFLQHLFADSISKEKNSTTINKQDKTATTIIKPKDQSVTFLEPKTIIESKIVLNETRDTLSTIPLPLQMYSPLDVINIQKKKKLSPFLYVFCLFFALITLTIFSFSNSRIDPLAHHDLNTTIKRTNQEPLSLIHTKKQQPKTVITPKIDPQLFAQVSIQTKPADAHIEITLNEKPHTANGNYQTTFPLLKNELEIPLKVSHPNYNDKELMLKIDKNTLVIDKNVTLDSLDYGHLKVTARPWGRAKVNGTTVNATPHTFKVPSGTQLVQVSYPPSKKTLSKYIQISSGKLTQCRATFNKKTSYMICN